MTHTKQQAMTEWFTDYLTTTTEGSPEVMPTPLLDSVLEDHALREESPLLMAAIEQEVRTETRSTVKTAVKKTRYSKTKHCAVCHVATDHGCGTYWVLTPIEEE